MNVTIDIKSLRNQKGLTQKELAEKAGVSLRTIQRIEKKEVVPQVYTLKQLAKAFDLEEDFVFCIEEKPAPESCNKLALPRYINGISVLLSFFPPVNLLVLVCLRHFKRGLSTNLTAQKIISFQMIWTVLLVLSIFLYPLLSYIIAGQTMVGEFPVSLATFMLFIFINIAVSWHVALKLNKSEFNLLSSIPILI
ncbi:MAG: helix-turn-helix domain-containing protein [Chitinophagales bacterium]|nr:helix-turn-helix domain-containing protein [Chitinophagales bacterium]